MERTGRRQAIVGMLAGALLLAACGGAADKAAATQNATGSATFGTIPAASGTPTDGGTLNISQPTGAGPYYTLPIVPAAFNSSYVMGGFQNLMFRPLYWTTDGATAQISETLSLAELPTYSEDNTTVTIELLSEYTWSDGNPVTAEDLAFTIELIRAALKKNPGNWAGYTPGRFPDNVTDVKVTDEHTLVLTLDKAYNPDWFTNNQLSNLTPLPVKAWAKSSDSGDLLDFRDPANAEAIYTYLDAAAKTPAEFATNPLWQVVNGPYRLSSFDVTTNAYSMVRNEKYTGPQKSHLETLNFRPFTSDTAAYNQLLSGDLTMGRLDPSNLTQAAALEKAGYTIYGGPQQGFNFIMLNFHDTTNNVDKLYAQPYIRQTLQHLINQPGYIASKGIYNGAAVQSYAPAPVNSPFVGEDISVSPYPYDPEKAKKLLTDHGWKVEAGGQTVCEKPGTGDGQCGADIPAGQTLAFNLFYRSGPTAPEGVSTAFASEAKKAGIEITIAPKTFSFLIQNFNLPAAPSKADEWAMSTWGGFNGITAYPSTSGMFDAEGQNNVGGFGDPEADELIHESMFGDKKDALKAEMSFMRTTLPVLWLPTAQTLWAWKTDLQGPEDSFASLPSTALTPEYWFLKK